MARKYLSLADGLDAAVLAAAETLQAGGVIVFPTETVYGVGVAAGDARALDRLRQLKQREASKPFQFLVADLAMAEALGAVFSPRAQNLAAAYWPGPLTLVVPDGSGDGFLGIRIPDAPFVPALCRRLGKAVISSSANPAGAPPPLDASAADAFGGEVDLLLDGGGIRGGVPSTVVKCLHDGFVILRHGGISPEAIASAWHE